MDGTAIRDWVLGILGTIFICILAIRGVAHWGKREWGDLIGLFATGAVVAAVVFFPDQTLTLIKWIAAKFF